MLTYTPEKNYDDRDDGLSGKESDTARLWVSDHQWLSILERVDRGEVFGGQPGDGSDEDFASGESAATGGRGHARHAMGFRCVIRLAPPENREADHGTYLVHSRNISSGGLGFVHDHELHAGTRCTVALQPPHGRGMILSAKVAWCRGIRRVAEDVLLYDVGVQFDRPIDVGAFIPAA